MSDLVDKEIEAQVEAIMDMIESMPRDKVNEMFEELTKKFLEIQSGKASESLYSDKLKFLMKLAFDDPISLRGVENQGKRLCESTAAELTSPRLYIPMTGTMRWLWSQEAANSLSAKVTLR